VLDGSERWNGSYLKMNLVIVAGSGNPALAGLIADRLGLALTGTALNRFPDGELNVEIEQSVRGCDVYLVQPTGPPADQHLVETLFLADACRRAGAARITAIMPYFGYARQDRRANGRQAIGGRVVADALSNAGLDRIVAVDLHTVSLEGFFTVPLEHLSAMALLANAVDDIMTDNSVIVAPDLGAAKLAERYAALLHRPFAVVHKTRVSGENVVAHGVVGEVKGRRPIIVDDMVSTAGTIAAASQALLEAGCEPELVVIATHGVLVGPAVKRLSALPLKRLIVTDSLPPRDHPLPIRVASLASILAEAASRLNVGESMDGLLSHS
jgi:ribose-phosphate pyrophosphokinase